VSVPHAASYRPHAEDVQPALDPALHRIVQAFPQDFPADVSALSGQALREAVYPVTRKYAYLNHAATGSLSVPVEQATSRFLRMHSEAGSLAFDAFEPVMTTVRARFAHLIGAQAEHIAFAKSVSDAMMTVAAALTWHHGDNIVTAESEFPSNVYPWLNLREHGVDVRFAPARDGRILLDDLAALVDDRTRLVTVSFVEFSTGFRNDLAAVGRIARAAGALFGVDGIQGIGALRLDVNQCEADFLASGTPKWLLAPGHSGLLYVRPELLQRLGNARRGWTSMRTAFEFFNYAQPQRDDAARLESGSNSITPLIGAEAALAIFEAVGMELVEQRILALADLLRCGLESQGHTVVSPGGSSERSGIICLRPRETGGGPVSVETLAQQLASQHQVIVSARNGLIRVSPHYYNTAEDITRLLHALEAATPVV